MITIADEPIKKPSFCDSEEWPVEWCAEFSPKYCYACFRHKKYKKERERFNREIEGVKRE